MKPYSFRIGAFAFAASLASLPLAVCAQTTVFNDTFNNGSTVQSASPASPTANSTAYEFFQGASTPSGATIAANDLHVQERSATSELGEVQALFTTAPVTLAAVGDWIDLTLVFTDTSGVLVSTASTTASLNVGLFNSAGVNPNQGRQLSNGTVSGGSQNWTGYGAKMFQNGTPQIFSRFAQTPNGTSSQNQDVLFGPQSGGGFNNPAAGGISQTSSGTTITLVAATTYTLDYRITLSAANTLTISNALYSGNSVAGSPLISQIGSTNSASLNYTFDAMAFGWREVFSPAASSSVDISSINVSALVTAPVPEPTTLALLASGAALALGLRRRQK